MTPDQITVAALVGMFTFMLLMAVGGICCLGRSTPP